MDLRKNIAWTDRSARKIKNKFLKLNKNGGTFQTVNGEVNTIEKIDESNIYIKCKTKDSVYKISIKSLSDAINQLYIRKSLKRNDLARNSRYNTALFGILIEIFKDKITIEKDKLDKRSWRILLKGVRFIPSGMSSASSTDWTLMKKAGVKIIMISYASVLKDGKERYDWYLWCIALDMLAIVDSGAFTKGRNKEVEISIYDYANYIKRFKSRIHDFINLDVIGDIYASRNNFNSLKELTGMNPIPVWHPSQIWEESNWDELELMVNSSDIVAIGGTHKSFFPDDNMGTRKKALFRRINELHPYTQFHYLGGSSRLILEDTWLFGQADSTALIHSRRHSKIYSFRNEGATEKRLANISSNEGFLYSLENLVGFEREYGEYKPNTDIQAWKSSINRLEGEIKANSILFLLMKKEVARKFKEGILVDIIESTSLDQQLMFNLPV